jgi:anti-sigma factor RsiW
MTLDQMQELIDLYLDDELPEALRALVESALAADPLLRQDTDSLRQTAARLMAEPAHRPDTWFVERTLDSLLHEDAAQTPKTAFPR